MSRVVLEAELTWTGGRFASGVQVEVGDHGRIDSVGPPRQEPTTRLDRVALLPGLVSSHSHAFQRGLRGSGESFPQGAGSFWSWREAMYTLVSSLDREALRRCCLQAFGEMRDAGFTAVGEFHYLHHERETDYGFDEVVLAAAADVGIRIVLLQSYYATGAIGKPLEGAQRRFRTRSLQEYWRQFERLQSLLDPKTQTLGVAPHSVRAVSLEEIAALYTEARGRGLPVHIHVEEQRREVEESRAAYGRRPMAAILDSLPDARGLTAVHCTHTTPGDMARFLDSGGRVCVCPLTEGNLGDGIPRLDRIHGRHDRLCVGTDSNLRLSALEELRWLEYAQRLRGELRGALPTADGDVAPTLLAAASSGGAAALGLDCGSIRVGCWGDMVAIDLDAAPLRDIPPERLLEAVILGAGNEIIAGTFVGGIWRKTSSRQ